MVLDIFNIYILVEAVWCILPAYAANGLVPVFKKWCRHPIDGGRVLGKNRLLGDGKSWEGLFIGILFGTIIALVEQFAYPFLPWDISPVPLFIAHMWLGTGFLLGLGAMVGDSVGSFIKRRIGLERGRPAFLLDQEMFLIFAMLFAALLIPIKYQWFVLLLVLTPTLHWIANLIGYAMHVTRRPW